MHFYLITSDSSYVPFSYPSCHHVYFTFLFIPHFSCIHTSFINFSFYPYFPLRFIIFVSSLSCILFCPCIMKMPHSVPKSKWELKHLCVVFAASLLLTRTFLCCINHHIVISFSIFRMNIFSICESPYLKKKRKDSYILSSAHIT